MKWPKWNELTQHQASYWGLGLIVLILGLSATLGSTSNEPMSEGPLAEIDTFIPAGYVLVPIEIENYQAVDSVLGKQGVVDLFIKANDRGNALKLVARRMRILRAPLNPTQFAVLSPESEVTRLMQGDGRFFVVLQNRKAAGTNFVKSRQKDQRLVFEEESNDAI